jgi:methyl-accepting chemotaxis protein
VVASEVKELSKQTHAASDEIAEEVENILSCTEKTVKTIQEIVDAMRSLSLSSTTTLNAIGEQRQATDEIAHNIHQASSAVQDVASSVAGVMTAAEDTTEASTTLLEQAQRLDHQATQLSE